MQNVKSVYLQASIQFGSQLSLKLFLKSTAAYELNKLKSLTSENIVLCFVYNLYIRYFQETQKERMKKLQDHQIKRYQEK